MTKIGGTEVRGERGNWGDTKGGITARPKKANENQFLMGKGVKRTREKKAAYNLRLKPRLTVSGIHNRGGIKTNFPNRRRWEWPKRGGGKKHKI